MAFDGLWGQDPALETLTRALESGRVHHAYRFEGPSGVGKEMAAFRLARALVCGEDPLGCGACSACRRAMTLSGDEPHVPLHPDVVLVGRGLYRSVTGQAEATGIGIEQIRRVVSSRVGFGPHEGRALVFVVRDAEELTPPAANSLLKTLEEPPQRTHFVLLTSRANRLLDTIRSRTVPVRFGPLPDAVLCKILANRGLPEDVAPLGQGSAETAILLASDDASRERHEFVAGARAALDAPDLASAIRFAESRKGDRDTLKAELGFLAQHLASDAREHVGDSPARAVRAAEQHALVLAAMDDLERNVQPALVLESMIIKMRGA